MSWIKLATSTPDKPEVFLISEHFGMDPDEALGKLVRFWIWADSQTTDGNAHRVTKTLIDRITHVSGFADAMISVGWLVESSGGFEIPNFERHNGNSAKSRALAQKRVQNHRGSRNGSVTQNALPEKRRADKKISIASDSKTVTTNRKSSRFEIPPPTRDDVARYAEERKSVVDPDRFFDLYEANGWTQGRGKQIRNWQAAFRTWEKNPIALSSRRNADEDMPDATAERVRNGKAVSE